MKECKVLCFGRFCNLNLPSWGIALYSFSLALVIAAVVGPQWLLTEEKIPVTTYHNNTHGQSTLTPITSINSVHNQQQLNIQHPHLIPATKDDLSGAFLTKYTKSSLWMLCSKYSGKLLLLFASKYRPTYY